MLAVEYLALDVDLEMSFNHGLIKFIRFNHDIAITLQGKGNA